MTKYEERITPTAQGVRHLINSKLVMIRPLTSAGSMNPCPLERQKNLTVPWLISSAILPDMDWVRVRRVTIISGMVKPSGNGDKVVGECIDMARFYGKKRRKYNSVTMRMIEINSL